MKGGAETASRRYKMGEADDDEVIDVDVDVAVGIANELVVTVVARGALPTSLGLI